MRTMIALVFLFVFSSCALAQTVEERLQELEKTLKRQEQAIQELKTLQNTVKKQEKTIEEQRKLIERLTKKGGEAQPSGTGAAAEAPQTAAAEQVKQEVEELKDQVISVAEAQKKQVLSVFNPAIGLVGETIFSYRSLGSKATGSDRPGGFDVNQRSVELNLAATIDPFAKGYAVINASSDPITGEATAVVEEAALLTTSLPCNLTLQAGRFFGEFGRLSYIHDHELPFVNRPLVLDQYIGGESRTDGVQLNYLLPIEHYVSLTAGVGNNFGAVPVDINDTTNGNFRSFGGLAFWGRGSTSFDLTADLSLEAGVSGLINPKTIDREGVLALPNNTTVTYLGSTLQQKDRSLEGVDVALSWKPLTINQFQTLTWGTEFLHSGSDFTVTGMSPDGTILFPPSTHYVDAYGMYSYLNYKFHRQWNAGFLLDWVENSANSADKTVAYSPYITWVISHWNQLRLQYTHTDHNAVSGLRPDDAIYLQWAWIIGSHAHGWQQR
ncbi:MAG TPA: hypothetical protein VEF34_13650 [Syntrophobacteraceae bacterium]|nr:hypothetical protein [Syntrophobacteraceae bacterium]